MNLSNILYYPFYAFQADHLVSMVRANGDPLVSSDQTETRLFKELSFQDKLAYSAKGPAYAAIALTYFQDMKEKTGKSYDSVVSDLIDHARIKNPSTYYHPQHLFERPLTKEEQSHLRDRYWANGLATPPEDGSFIFPVPKEIKTDPLLEFNQHARDLEKINRQIKETFKQPSDPYPKLRFKPLDDTVIITIPPDYFESLSKIKIDLPEIIIHQTDAKFPSLHDLHGGRVSAGDLLSRLLPIKYNLFLPGSETGGDEVKKRA